MSEVTAGLLVFLCLTGAALGSLLFSPGLPARYRDAETVATVRLAAGLFTLMVSLVLGLTVNSARNAFESADHNEHVMSTEIILLDRALRRYGPDAQFARKQLVDYAKSQFEAPREEGQTGRSVEDSLDNVGNGLNALKPSDGRSSALWQDASRHFQRIVELRWTLLEQSDGTIPTALVIMLVAWLTLIFASFGYAAPRNAFVVMVLLVSALLISASLYLILDMETAFTGPIQVTSKPAQRTLLELTR